MKTRILTTITCLFLILVVSAPVTAQQDIERLVDSLFVIASSAEVIHQDMVEPAREAIAQLGAPAVPYLIEKFETKSARERWAVIFVLRKIGSAAVPDLVAALNREDGTIVQRVCWALGDIKDSTATLPLIDVTTHQRWQVRDQSINALGKIGDDRAREVVLAALVDTIGQVRKSAVVASRQLEMTEAIPTLIGILDDDFYGARLTAFETLAGMDSALTIPLLGDSLVASNGLLGDYICDLLGLVGGDRAIDLLATQLEIDRAARQEHAAVALCHADPFDHCGHHARFLNDQTDPILRVKLESVIDDRRRADVQP